MNYSNKTPIVFSQVVKNQIIGLDLTFGLYNTLADDKKLPKKSKDCISRVRKRVKNIKNIIYQRDVLVLKSSDHKKYKSIIKNIQEMLVKVDLGLDYFNTVLMVVEDIRISTKNSNNKELYREWVMLSQSLNTLYTHSDPDLSKEKYMKLGKSLGMKIYELCK